MAVETKKDYKKSNRKLDMSTLVYGKVPPQAPEMEEAVLGAIMLERDRLDEVMEIIWSPDCFYVDAHQKIFAALCSMYERSIQVDSLTLTDELRKRGELEAVGGVYYVTQLTMKVVSAAHIEIHSRIILEKYIQREMIRMSGEVIGDAYEDSTDVFELLDKAESNLFQIATRMTKKNYRHVSKGTFEVMKKIDEMRASSIEFTGIDTGYRELNEKTGGWQKTDLIIIGARPGVGKTAFTLNLAINCASNRHHGGGVGIFNLEMAEGQLIERAMACISGVELKHIKRPKLLSTEEIAALTEAQRRFATLPVYIDDTAGINMTELRAKARKMVRKHDVKLLIVDYLQLIEGDSRAGNREQEMSKISRQLKKMAKDLDVPIIALSQMSREVEKNGRAPMLSDLRESGAIEQDADMVMFLHKPTEALIKKSPEYKTVAYGNIAKHRNGEVGDMTFYADNNIQRWMDGEPDQVFTTINPIYVDGGKRTVLNPGQPAITNAPMDGDNLPF